jgi:ATP-binding cassette subfamily B protein
MGLLQRLHDPERGSIRVDGVDVRELKRGALRRTFGMVLQDTWLFSGTIRDNIAYGREHATDEAIVRAAKAAQADHFIRTLPENYQTLINQEASNLSQGQKQLLTIARAFLADPAVLILDEATSSVDTRTEVLIQRAMAELMRGRTTFVIAHRLSTIRNADVILMLEHGRIVERGTHQALLAAKGHYAALYHSQFAGRAAQAVAS